MTSVQSLKSRISQLLEEKGQGQRVDNELHDTGVELAQLLLTNKFPNRTWILATNNKKGIDVQGYLGDKLDVVCEVTTHDLFQGNRRTKILNDLQRLQDTQVQNKFLAIVHAEVLIQIRSMRSRQRFQGIEVLDLPTLHFERLGE